MMRHHIFEEDKPVSKERPMKQIDEMAEIIQKESNHSCKEPSQVAQALHDAGYRKVNLTPRTLTTVEEARKGYVKWSDVELKIRGVIIRMLLTVSLDRLANDEHAPKILADTAIAEIKKELNIKE